MPKDFTRSLVRSGIPFITPILRDTYRLKIFARHIGRAIADATRWYVSSKEYTNYTYEISAKNRLYLTAFLSSALGFPREDAERYINEIELDQEITAYFERIVPTTNDRYYADLPLKFGRRMGWYAIIRHCKPKVVIESGIDRGLGTTIMAAALRKNASEGEPGKVYGLDINPYAGSYIAEPYAEFVELRYGDSVEFLQNTDLTIDIFIHDSNHSYEHECREFELVGPKVAPGGLLISDNAEETPALFEYARAKDKNFAYWQEENPGHITSPGAIGLVQL